MQVRQLASRVILSSPTSSDCFEQQSNAEVSGSEFAVGACMYESATYRPTILDDSGEVTKAR